MAGHEWKACTGGLWYCQNSLCHGPSHTSLCLVPCDQGELSDWSAWMAWNVLSASLLPPPLEEEEQSLQGQLGPTGPRSSSLYGPAVGSEGWDRCTDPL